MFRSGNEQKSVSIALIAILSVLALPVVVIVLAVMTIPIQEVEAGCERGNAASFAFNQSKGRCLDSGTL